MRSPASSILLIWFAVACLMPSAGGLRGVVLCFSTQGHVVFEAEHADPDCTTECGSPTVAEVESGGLSDADSHRCFDLMLSRIDMRRSQVRDSRHLSSMDWTPMPVPTVAIAASASLTDAHGRAAWSPPPILAANRSGLRTVILRV